MSENPYATPLSSPASAPMSDAEAIRTLHISHEASVKTVGILFLLGACLLVPVGLILIAGAVNGDPADPGDRAAMVGIGFVYFALGLLQAAAGIGLRRLRPWARNVAVFFAVIGLLGIPLGTIISGYILYLLLSQKGSMVFSKDYQRIVAETPYIKHKTSTVLIVLLILLLVLFVGAISAALLLDS